MMTPKKPRTGLRVLLLMLVMTPILLWSMSSSALYGPGSPERRTEKNLALSLAPRSQCHLQRLTSIRSETATFEAPVDPPDWVNGNAGASNSHYFEGQSIPYRLRLTNIALTTHVVEIEWDIKHSGANAIDYITHYDRINEDVQPCRGVSGCNAAVFNTKDILAPSSNGSPMAGQPTASFNALPAAQRVMTIYNGSIQTLTYVSEGSLTAAQSSTRLQISFTATSSTVVIAWGGHIASAAKWGQVILPVASVALLTTRLISFDGSGGNQDRSLSAAAVLRARRLYPHWSYHRLSIRCRCGRALRSCDSPRLAWTMSGVLSTIRAAQQSPTQMVLRVQPFLPMSIRAVQARIRSRQHQRMLEVQARLALPS